MSRKYILIVWILLLSISPCSASWYDSIITDEITSYNVDDVTYFSVDYAGEDQLVSWIVLDGINPADVSNITVTTDTYDVNISINGTMFVDVDVDLQDKVNGTSYSYSDTWFRLNPFDDLQFYIGSSAGAYTGDVRGGVTNIKTLFEHEIQNSQGFVLQSDDPIDLEYMVASFDFADGEISMSSFLLELVGKIPILGEYIIQVIEVVAAIMNAFFVAAVVFFTNWTFFLVVFETFVLMHATSILQKKSSQPSSHRITESVTAIASDQVILFTFLISATTAIIGMFTGAVRMIRG